MQKSIIIASAIASLFLSSSVYAETCSHKVYGETVEEAFKAGAELVKLTDGGNNVLDANTTIRILPEKENGMFVVKVSPSLNTNYCPLEHKSIETVEHKAVESTVLVALNQ